MTTEVLYAERDRWLGESGGTIQHRIVWTGRHQVELRWYGGSVVALEKRPCSLMTVEDSYAEALGALLGQETVWKGLAHTPKPEAP